MEKKITSEVYTKNKRQAKINEVLKISLPSRTGYPVNYRGKRQEFDVYRVPLNALVYNPYNGRIGSVVKSYEKQTEKKINPENILDVDKIEKFLWDSHSEHNERTLEDLIKNGQKEIGIITRDGMIVDGNRRAMLLNTICKRRAAGKYSKVDTTHTEYFETIILPEDADAKEINRLEAEYQMGVDAKQDYDPIEKYFKCKDLHDIYNFDIVQISNMMGESENQIREWLAITDLMEEYLKYFGFSGYYTLLRKKEDLFINLYKWIKKFENLNSNYVDWSYSSDDLYDLKEACFLYIRAGFEGKEFRNIAQGKKNSGIFKKQIIWKKFKEGSDKIRTLEEKNEIPVKDVLKSGGDVIGKLKKRDDEFQVNIIESLEKNMDNVMDLLKEKNLKSLPLEVIVKARSSIKEVSPSLLSNNSSKIIKELTGLSEDVSLLIMKIKKNEI